MTARTSPLPLLVVLVLLAGGCADGDTTTADGRATTTAAPAFVPDGRPVEDAATAIDEIFAGQGFVGQPGCAVSAVIDGDVVFAGGYGAADLETGEPITERTTFDIASVSKQFTAAAIYLLAEDGALSVDDEIHAHVPELPDYGVDITLDDLLHHMSGLVDYTELLAEQYDDTDVTTAAQALDALGEVPELTFEPGSEFEYNNTNYFLLGLVVAEVSDGSLGEFLHDEVFGPLGMSHTVVRDDATRPAPEGAEGYTDDGAGGFQADTTKWEQVGDGSVWTSVSDLQRWAANLTTFAVGGPALRRDLLTPGAIPDEDGVDYGGGLSLLPDGWLEHSGAWAGFVSDLVVHPDRATSVAVLCNRDDADPAALAEAVVTAL